MRRFLSRVALLACTASALSCEGAAPLQPVPVEQPFASVSAGGYTTCALTTVGDAFCWGRGTSGQLGNGGEQNQDAPVPVTGGHRFTSLSAGYYHACGLTGDGRAWCWGATPKADNAGQLGSGSESEGSLSPVPVRTAIRFLGISAGQMHTCALATDGRAYCWGDNRWGQLGDGTTQNRNVPVAVFGDHRFRSLSAGATHTCGATTAGEALCWGDNFFGAVTGNALAHTPDTCDGGGDRRCTLLPHLLEIVAPLEAVSAGYASTCATARGGAWICWGGNPTSAAPPVLLRSAPVAAVSSGASHWCAVTTAGAAMCRGSNALGQLGAGDEQEFAPEPVAVTGGLSFISLATGMFHTCGVTDGGFAYCWGSNLHHALGGAGTPNTCFSETCRRSPGRVRGQHPSASP